MVVLDEATVKNLRIETAEAEETTFETTAFALGELQVLPGRRAVVSSRIPGRAFSVLALPHQQVEEGDELMWVESRQPGDPPPTVMIPAPMSGLVSRVDTAVGQPVHPDQLLMEIVDLSTVEASARVPQHLAGRLSAGQAARIRVTALPGQVFEAKLAHLGVYADEKSGTVEAAFHLANPQLALRPGMRAEFTIVLARREGVLGIPRAALLGGAGDRHVYVRDFDLPNAFIKAPVAVGEVNDRFAEILSGLLPADEVVTRGAYPLSFAGQGSLSLKEALDAAHGHEHAADGSELPEDKKAADDDHDHENEEGHDHGHEHEQEGVSVLWMHATGVLALLLVLSLLVRRGVDDHGKEAA